MSFNKAKVLKSAEKYVQQGKIPSAIDEYRKIVEADPNDLTMINTLGDLCVRAGRTEEAIMNFSRIAENYRENGFTLKAIAMYKKISKLEPSNYETSLKLADLYSKQGLIVDARQQYLLVADAYKKTGQTRQALEVLKKIADLDPENTSVRLKLAESYQVENMYDEAHEAYIAAGQEFLKKGKVSDAIQSYQRAVSINPDSKSAIKAMVDALLQQGDLDQALEMLGSALDKNPGDVDLIVLLGRTYLNGKMLSEAEETFSRLLELDKSRYDYLIEVGKRYLEKGQFDSTINTVDKCVDLLIARRQEEKAINLLRGILDYDANHMTALKRLSDIYLRVREDYNLAATLNTIAEVAMRRGMKDDAIEALKQLAEIEPDEPSHKQRLASLGVTQSISYTPPPAFTDFGQPAPAELPKQVVAPPERFSTSPLSFPQTEMQIAEKQLREAEMFASRGYADHAAELLDDLINRHPDYIDARLKLRQIYIDGGLEEKASFQCVELSRLYEAKGDKAASSAMMSEAYKLNPSLSGLGTNNGPATFGNEFAVEIDLSGNITDVGVGTEGADYQMPAYQPSAFTQMPNDLFSSPTPMPNNFEQTSQPPTSFEALFSTSPTSTSAPPPAQISVKGAVSGDEMKSFEINFNDEAPSTAHLAKDKILRDELEGVDFYIAQGYLDIARDTLENLDKQYPNHPAILQRFEKLGISSQTAVSAPEIPMEELPESAILESTK
ncbi:MAG: tetratricopeptide repeat protein, partial [Blastocatellia bacterium]|nr:tetratricopeptide repeat protein [Blastocatellia bacterium]